MKNIVLVLIVTITLNNLFGADLQQASFRNPTHSLRGRNPQPPVVLQHHDPKKMQQDAQEVKEYWQQRFQGSVIVRADKLALDDTVETSIFKENWRLSDHDSDFLRQSLVGKIVREYFPKQQEDEMQLHFYLEGHPDIDSLYSAHQESILLDNLDGVLGSHTLNDMD